MQWSFLTCNSWVSASLGHLEFSAKARLLSMCYCSIHPLVQQALSGAASSEPSVALKQHIRLCLVQPAAPDNSDCFQFDTKCCCSGRSSGCCTARDTAKQWLVVIADLFHICIWFSRGEEVSLYEQILCLLSYPI